MLDLVRNLEDLFSYVIVVWVEKFISLFIQGGDRVGVVRKETGTVHFFVNGIDQGAAASNVPENVFGVIDLYGRASQATIIDQNGMLVHRILKLCLIMFCRYVASVKVYMKYFLGTVEHTVCLKMCSRNYENRLKIKKVLAKIVFE